MNQAVLLNSVPVNTRCIHCMGELDSPSQACPHCGHPEQTFYPHPLYLSPHTLLQEQYLLGRVLGQGGFGITYIGLDLKLNKRVAIKEYLPSSIALRQPESGKIMPLHHQAEALRKGLDSFINEARNLAKFNHPNIVRVLNYFEENQTAYMVMEYLQGDNPARRLCDHGGQLSIDAALQMVLPILDALEAIHAQQVFHLDVSAHNVLLTQHDVPVLIDFGAARSVSVIAEHTRSMTLVLKPGYSPLEQYSDQGNIGAWTDIYACAALLYLLLHGKLPPAATERWQQDNLVIALAAQDDNRVPSIERALKKALAVNIQQRWQTVAEFRAALLAPLPHPLLRPAFAYTLLSGVLLATLATVWFMQQNTSTISTNQPIVETVTTPVAIEKPPPQTHPLSPDEVLQAATTHWLNAAQEQMQAQQFTAAYQIYQAILRLQPQQNEALQGLEQLASAQLAQAQQLYQQERYTEGLALVQQSQQVFPAQQGFSLLQQAFEQALASQARQAQLAQLLRKAEAQLQAQKLTKPPEDNAYASYQALLAIAPDDPRVQQLPARIVENYAQLAETTQNLEKRHDLIQKGLAIVPDHAGLLALQKNLQQPVTETVTVTEVSKPEPPINVAFAPPEPPKVVQIDPAQQQTEQINQWLQVAQQAFAQDNLEVAHENYQKILALQPQNAIAYTSLQAIAARYTKLAQQQKNLGELAESLVLVGKGLGVQAQYPDLLRLQQELREELNKPPALSAEAEKNPETAPTKPLLLTPSF